MDNTRVRGKHDTHDISVNGHFSLLSGSNSILRTVLGETSGKNTVYKLRVKILFQEKKLQARFNSGQNGYYSQHSIAKLLKYHQKDIYCEDAKDYSKGEDDVLIFQTI